VALDLDALEEEARTLLEPGAFDYIAGGAEDEVTLADNVEAWKRVRIRPKVLRDVSAVDASTTLLGQRVTSPIGIAPTAFHRLAHPDGEEATAQAAAETGSLMVLSTRATATAAEVRAVAPDALLWFQVYVLTDRKRTARLIEAAVGEGAKALVLTADTPFLGRRLRDVRNRFVLPANIGDASSSLALEPGEEGSLVDQDPSITFDDIGWLASIGDVPVVVKGVLRGDDAARCVEAGAAGVWVSNHGGRQLDGAIATADALPDVVAAVGEGAEVYVDGGIRRGSDALKGLALGARAVFVGRPVLWGLATGGSKGVVRVLHGLQGELTHAMSLAGAPTVADLTPDLVAG
jgi:4-hydroxymandelate oxidase